MDVGTTISFFPSKCPRAYVEKISIFAKFSRSSTANLCATTQDFNFYHCFKHNKSKKRVVAAFAMRYDEVIER
jgi:hypothetical protein